MTGRRILAPSLDLARGCEAEPQRKVQDLGADATSTWRAVAQVRVSVRRSRG